MTESHRAVLAATFAPGEAAVPAARRFTREVMTAWAASAVLPAAEQVTGEMVAQIDGAPFEVVWGHRGHAVQLEIRQKDVTREHVKAPSVPVEEWGLTFSGDMRTHWVRLALPGSAEQVAAEWSEETKRGPYWLGFLADASDLLASALDPDLVPAIIAQIVVPRLATWCAVYTSDEGLGPLRPAYLWHADEARIDSLREQLATIQIPPAQGPGTVVLSVADSQVLAVPLLARGRGLGVMCLGRTDRFPDDIIQFAEDIGRRAALAMDNARLYAQQAAANRALQRSLLPPGDPDVPGLDYGVVYEPAGETNEVGGDFYDLFACADGAWRFAIGDVCGTGPEAAAVTGLARHTLRLLAREGHGVAAVLGRLNEAILEEGERARFLTLLHGEITQTAHGLDVKLVSAGHPEALRLRPSGVVEVVATPQSLLGVFPEVSFEEDLVRLDHDDVLLAVTDGVTERRSGSRLLDDDGGLAKILAECVGLSAQAVAERIRRRVQDFAPEPSADDLAILVLRAG
ncbi:serine phosphatase RsbU (regulator of sigma subunit) [Thermocatellispora tengchongensis]|uniref:Serine phosphatase RsbU (Regulator of sigma subunit) n=1 Tax=Thermocatellispora tengchongensis TaxID=1073253 RepID=A0A840NTP6_9ACTN|nr:SpoIIE family protein phosphatase [Thermocatellispora tengchongensis]MBB5130948.1 serine phosphatase RsbU (regulator of sigma subunit) [Thermocatellispora tengchongensis]